MDASPLVSVIVPSYNHAAYLRECIDSVLGQDHQRTELIVVDDGSSDGSLDILRGYGAHLTLLQQHGGRQARGRNLGLAAAHGEIIAFLDSDDRYLPGRLSSAVAALGAAPEVDVVWGDYRLIDARGAIVGQSHWTPRDADFRLELIAGNPICNGTVTLRRAVLDAIGGFDERVPRVCDGAAWYQIAARGHRFLHLDRTVLDYRLHGTNDSTRFAPMARDRDTAHLAAAQAYVAQGVVSGATDLDWLRQVLVRQYSFRAAAWVQRQGEPNAFGVARARLYEALGSDRGLRLWGALHRWKHRGTAP
jgi:glycosyltransferase involved in cell wall biosynthesis